MAQEAASWSLVFGAGEDGCVSDKGNRSSLWRTLPTGTLAEAGRINALFGYRIEQRMHAYTGDVNDFGCPGNMVDNWRVQFTERQTSLKTTNGRNGRK
jgi:hypothetical protein